MDDQERDARFALAFADDYRYLLKVASRYAPYGHVEDVVQAALLKAWTRRGQFRGDCPIKAWLSVIVRNEAYILRKCLANECDLPDVLQDHSDAYSRIDDMLTLSRIFLHADERKISVLKAFLANPIEKPSGAIRMKRIRAIAEIRRRLHLE
jgi:DNA-directed RNA polymerase specialized sigma24 family protein